MKNKENIIVDLSLDFALQIISYCEELEKVKKYIIANQLLKSGTSIGANINESQNSESKSDFIHKHKIAAKEANETDYWLKLCLISENYPNPNGLEEKLVAIQKILNKIISTSKNTMKQSTN